MTPEIPPEALAPPPIKDPNGSIMVGCLTGCGVQIGFFALSGLFMFLFDSQLAGAGLAKYENWIFMSWGLTQWIAIIPMILSNQKKGRRSTVQGLVIAGAIGVLLSSACASMLGSLGNMH